MGKLQTLSILSLVLCLWTACGPGYVTQEFPPDPQAAGYVMLERPISLPQGKVIYDCGPEAITAVLNYHGQSVNVDEASKVLYNPKLKGTLSFELAPYARSKGMATRYYEGSLGKIRDAVQRQVPPIIMFEASGMLAPIAGSYFHFFVVSGYNDQTEVVVTEFYNNQKFLIPYSELENRWGKTKYFFLEVFPADVLQTVRTAQDLEARHQHQQARELYQKALAKNPDYQPAVLGLGNTYYRLGDTQQALAHYEKANKLDPYDPIAMNNLSHVYVELGQNLEEAEILTTRALDSYRRRYMAAKAYVDMETDDTARQEARNELKQVQHEYALAQGTLGQVQFARKNFAGAIATWELALTVTPESAREVRARRHFELGRAYTESGMTDQAKECFNRALELTQDPDLKKAVQKAIQK